MQGTTIINNSTMRDLDTLNLQELTFEEQVNTEGGWLGTVGIVVGILYAAYELGYNYGKDAAERERRNK